MKKKRSALSELPSGKLYFVTNQLNLREIITSGFIGSIYSYDDKYYDDLLSISPGNIPLFSVPVGGHVLGEVVKGDIEIANPVFVEIDSQGLLIDKARVSSTPMGSSSIQVVVYADIIPFRIVEGIYFGTQEELEEFSVRSFRDLPDVSHLFRVRTEELENQVDFESVVAFIKDAKQSDGPNEADFKRLDRISGAASLAFVNGEKKSSINNDIFELVRSGSLVGITDLPDWFKLGFEPKTDIELAALGDLNSLLFAATVTVLHGFNWQNVSKRIEILSAIENLTDKGSISSENKVLLQAAFKRTRKYLNNEIEFEPFKKDGNDVSKALLLFLLRPKYSDLIVWSIEDTGANEHTMATALVFSGLVFGRKSLDVILRPREFDAHMVDAIIDNLRSKVSEKVKKPIAKKGVPKKSLKADLPKIIFGDVKEEVKPHLHEYASAFFSGELDSRLKSLAIDVSKKLHWYDCFYSEILIDTGSSTLTTHVSSNEVRVRVNGPFYLVEHLDVINFRTRLRDATDGKKASELLNLL